MYGRGQTGDRARAGTVIALACNIVHLLATLSEPYMPAVAAEMLTQLNAKQWFVYAVFVYVHFAMCACARVCICVSVCVYVRLCLCGCVFGHSPLPHPWFLGRT